MSDSADRWKIIKLEIKYFENEDQAKAGQPQHEDSIEFKDEGLASLMEIHPNPTKAIVLALQIALKLKRFDVSSGGSLKIQSEKMKGKIEIPDWK